LYSALSHLKTFQLPWQQNRYAKRKEKNTNK
jgi:hypothetical protein